MGKRISSHSKTAAADRKRGNGRHTHREKSLQRLIEDRLYQKVSYSEYREKVRNVYDGPKGAILATCSMLSLHIPLGDRLLRERKFDLRGARHILDVGSGAGQIARHLLKYADADAEITCFDLSSEMLRRARQRLKTDRPRFVAADLSTLPFADASFDCVTCGYVLEHLPDPSVGLSELARVMKPGAKMLLLTTEDNLSGAWTSRIWCCRTYNRRELARVCESLGLQWHKELWYTRMHQVLRAGGICVEIVKESRVESRESRVESRESEVTLIRGPISLDSQLWTLNFRLPRSSPAARENSGSATPCDTW